MTTWSCHSVVKVILGILQKFWQRGYASSTYLFHEAKRDYVSLHKQYSWVEKDGAGTKESDLRLASYFASLGERFCGKEST